MHALAAAAPITKCKQIHFVRAAPVSSVLTSYTENSSRATVSGEEVRSFYETLLAEPGTATDPDKAMTMKIEKIRKNRFRKPTKTSSAIILEQNINGNNFEKVFKDAADGNLQSIKDYYRKGMDINISDRYGWTPLMCASYAGHLHIVKYLLSLGADISKRSKSGETVDEFALKCGHHEIYQYIISHKRDGSMLSCELSLPGIKKSQKTAEITRFCDVCQCNFECEAHLSSITHLMETRKPLLDPGYAIPEWNRGYRILRSSGWDEFEGLGRNASGRRYPIKTVLKRDRLGLGCGIIDTPKVTHFKANDVNAVRIKSATGGEKLKNQRKQTFNEKILERRFRSMFKDD